jgi:hypothetical protein
MFRRKFLMAAIVAGIATLAGPATSQAGFSVTFTVGASTTTIFDNGAGDYAFLNSNTIVTGSMDTAGNTTGVPFPLPPFHFMGFDIALRTSHISTSGEVNIDSHSELIIKYVGADPSATIRIEIVADSLTNPGAAGDGMTLFHRVTGLEFFKDNGTTGGVGSLDTWATADPPGASTPVISLTSGGPAADGDETVNFIRPVSYDLIQTVDLTLNRDNSAQFDMLTRVNPVPAPAGLILAATALPFVGLIRRRLRKPEATTAA